MARVDLVLSAIKSIPHADPDMILKLEFGYYLLMAAGLAWLVCKAYQGFFDTQEFILEDERRHRW